MNTILNSTPEEGRNVHMSHRVNRFWEGIASNCVPIESFSSAKSNGVINPSEPRWFDFSIHNQLRLSHVINWCSIQNSCHSFTSKECMGKMDFKSF